MGNLVLDWLSVKMTFSIMIFSKYSCDDDGNGASSAETSASNPFDDCSFTSSLLDDDCIDDGKV